MVDIIMRPCLGSSRMVDIIMRPCFGRSCMVANAFNRKYGTNIIHDTVANLNGQTNVTAMGAKNAISICNNFH